MSAPVETPERQAATVAAEGAPGAVDPPPGAVGPRWRPSWPRRRHLQVVLGLLWLLDAGLQLQPYMFKHGSDGFLGPISENTMGAPNPATDLVRHALTVFVAHQVAVNLVIVVVQAALGFGLLWRRSVRWALAGTVLWSTAVWVVGEGYGQLLFPQASMLTGAPGAALVYAVLTVVLWPRRDPLPDEPVAAGGLGGERLARGAWVALWCGTALLELEYGNHAPDAITAQLHEIAVGQPGFLAALETGAAHLVAGRGEVVAAVLAIAQFLVGWWALRRRTLPLSLAAGVVLSVLFWVVGQGLGTVLTGQGTDPNLGPPMVLLALALWPRAARQAERVPSAPVTAPAGDEGRGPGLSEPAAPR